MTINYKLVVEQNFSFVKIFYLNDLEFQKSHLNTKFIEFTPNFYCKKNTILILDIKNSLKLLPLKFHSSTSRKKSMKKSF